MVSHGFEEFPTTALFMRVKRLMLVNVAVAFTLIVVTAYLQLENVDPAVSWRVRLVMEVLHATRVVLLATLAFMALWMTNQAIALTHWLERFGCPRHLDCPVGSALKLELGDDGKPKPVHIEKE